MFAQVEHLRARPGTSRKRRTRPHPKMPHKTAVSLKEVGVAARHQARRVACPLATYLSTRPPSRLPTARRGICLPLLPFVLTASALCSGTL